MKPTSLTLWVLLIGMVACRRAEESNSTSSKVAATTPTTGPSEHSAAKDPAVTPGAPPRPTEGSAGGSTLIDPEDARLHEEIEACDREITMLEATLAERSEMIQLIQAAADHLPEGRELPQDAQDILAKRKAILSRIEAIDDRRRHLIKQAEERRRSALD